MGWGNKTQIDPEPESDHKYYGTFNILIEYIVKCGV